MCFGHKGAKCKKTTKPITILLLWDNGESESNINILFLKLTLDVEKHTVFICNDKGKMSKHSTRSLPV